MTTRDGHPEDAGADDEGLISRFWKGPVPLGHGPEPAPTPDSDADPEEG